MSNKTFREQIARDYAGFAPRREQTERAVSRFLYYLVKAQTASFFTEPRLPHETGKLVSAEFFAARFTDAKGALRRYNYNLEGIIPGFNWSKIIARPLLDGNVLIENTLVKNFVPDKVLPNPNEKPAFIMNEDGTVTPTAAEQVAEKPGKTLTRPDGTTITFTEEELRSIDEQLGR